LNGSFIKRKIVAIQGRSYRVKDVGRAPRVAGAKRRKLVSEDPAVTLAAVEEKMETTP